MEEDKKNKIANACLLTFLILLIFIIIYQPQKNPEFRALKNKLTAGEKTKVSKKPVEVTINDPVALSGLSKKEVYDIRKKYVEKSIFNDKDYQPDENVFGEIEDGKPWMSMKLCQKADTPITTDGPSEESREIVNPSILVTIDDPFWTGKGECPYGNEEKITPVRALYYPADNSIDVWYKGYKKEFSYLLKGINARDFGYQYAYIDLNMSKNANLFYISGNITKNVVEFGDFIHRGGACGVEGGCNNGSPYQNYLAFGYRLSDMNEEHILYIKLWKEYPKSKNQKPDFTERLIITP